MVNANELRSRAAEVYSQAQAVLGLEAKTAEERSANVAKARTLKTDADSIMEQAKEIEDLEARNKQAAKETPSFEVRDNKTDMPWSEGETGVGEFLIAVANATRGRGFDPRLEKRAPSGMQTGIGIDGGFGVDKDFVRTVLTRVYDRAILASRCTRMTVSSESNGVKIPYVDETSRATGSRWGGVRAYWLSEGTAPTASKPKFGRWELDLGKIGAYGYATEEMLSDASLLAGVMLDAFRDEIAFELDDAIFRGDGNGKPKGVLTANASVTVSKEGSQTADTVNWNNVAKMFGRVAPQSVTRGAWFINQGVYSQLLLMTSAATSASTPMFVPPGRVADAPFGTLYGRPIVVLEHASAIGDLGDITFLDLSEYVLIEKGGVQAAESMHVKFDTDEMTYRLTYRVNGYPKWKSALTPYKGSDSYSPFVLLEAR